MRSAPKLPSELPLPVKSTDFSSRLRGPQLSARVGLWLGVCFGIAFVTGVWSHYAQSTPAWLTMPTRPVNLYRVTQGLHIVAGSVAVPLLLVKLWSVYPNLFRWPAVRSVKHALERAREQGWRSLAFPIIGAGSGGFDEERALAIMRAALEPGTEDLEVTVVRYRPGQL